MVVSSLLMLLLELCIVGLICYVLIWAVGYIGLGAPFDKIARVIVVIIVILLLLGLLMNFTGHPMIRMG